ncbi:hypothetical protein SMU85_09000 [Streptococcus mutans ST6]|nr:hypothetical protein SMU85_09000 [Streptococcus mutans ST6]
MHKQEPRQKFLEPVIKKVEQINRTLEVGVSAITVNRNLLHQVLTIFYQ